MINLQSSKLGLFLLISISMVGCSSQEPVPYAQIGSSKHLRINKNEDAVRIPYTFERPVDWTTYHNVMLEPIVIYKGPDAQFAGLEARDKTALANEMTAVFSEELGRRFRFASSPSAGTLRIRITLTGAETTTSGLSTFSRFDIGLGSYNLVQSMRDREGTFTGSVNYAVEIFDAPTSQLLKSYVTHQYPTIYDISSTFGALTAAKAGIKRGAVSLVESLSSR